MTVPIETPSALLARPRSVLGRILSAIRWIAFLIVAGFVGVWLFVLGAMTYFGAQGIEPALATKADAIVVLSSDVDENGLPDPATAARVEASLALYKAGVAPTLAFSGGNVGPLRDNVVIAEAMRDYAVLLGARPEDVVLEGRSISTFENARFLLDIAEAEGWRSIVVVTDDFHLARSRILFAFWDGDRDVEVVALGASNGLWRSPPLWRMWMLLREVLAYPFNTVKLAGQIWYELNGRGDERLIR